MDKLERRKTRAVKVGSVVIGGGAPVVIQSMTNTRTADTGATLAQIGELAEAGCELVRLAVPDRESAHAFNRIAALSPLPLVADIHFDHQLACLVLDGGAAKVRINPGNIGGKEKLIDLARRAQSLGKPLRIGVNAGSLERKLLKKYGSACSGALVESALGYLQWLEEIGFDDLVISLKASDVLTTIKAYRLMAAKNDYPLHLGVTGAGPCEAGLVKGSVGIGTLLAEGIGDTVRVSLTASPVEEVRAARRILQALGLGSYGPELISCPTCGRCETDLVSMVEKVETMLKNYDLPFKVAVMGCVVNGPGEAREADLGISAGRKQGILFRRGKVIRTVAFDRLLPEFKRELEAFAAGLKGGA